jgi:hypothetical protein
MRKRVLLQSAMLLAATVNLSEVAASCFPPAKGQRPLDVLKCLQSELDSQQKRIAELEKEIQHLRHNNFPQLHFLNCGKTYTCTPKMCLDKCISLGLRMATFDEVYAWASQRKQRCVWMWMLHSQEPGKVYRSFPMYYNQTTGGCGATNTGNIPRMVEPIVVDWHSDDKYDCACAGIR